MSTTKFGEPHTIFWRITLGQARYPEIVSFSGLEAIDTDWLSGSTIN